VPQRAQPSFSVASTSGGHSGETAGDKPEEGGDDVKSSWPLRAGLHTCYNGIYNGSPPRERALISKRCLSSDCTLQLGCMKSESLVIVDQHATVNTFPGLVHTARHTMGVGSTRRRSANRKEAAGHGRVSDWGEVVTR
ncbi:unnamed protein product, partial [Pararhodospirillum photometricum DSM 122]